MDQKIVVIPDEGLKTVRRLIDEMERVKLVGEALHDRVLKEIFIQTGIDLHYENCELDIERGILTCKESSEETVEVVPVEAAELTD